MPLAQLGHVLNELNSQIRSSNNLVTTVKRFKIPNIQLEIIAEMAFLRIFMAWENFLEESFIRYMIGAKSSSGYHPRVLSIYPNAKIARNIIKGESREYIKWNSANYIIARAEIHFKNGEPYNTPLNAMTTEFNDFNTVRNRIAHKSIHSRDQFKKLIRRTFGHSIHGMTPGRYLLTANTSSRPPLKFLEYYTQTIQVASLTIVP